MSALSAELDALDAAITESIAERNQLIAANAKLRAEMQAMFARTGVIDSLDACLTALSNISEYLESRDDCCETNIDKATDAIKEAFWRVKRQQEDIKDGCADDAESIFQELKADDDRMRAADIRAEQRK